MWMDVMAALAAIQEDDDDLVPDFCADHRAQNSEPVRLRLRTLKSVVRIFDVPRLRPLHFQRPRLRDGRSIQKITAARRVVPGNVFGRDVVMARCGKARRKGTEEKAQP